MPKQTPVSLETPSISEERLRQLQELAPEAFTEGKIDFEKLRLLLGGAVDENPERYSFNWSGKRDAIRILSMPSRATLTPDKSESVNFDTTENLFIEGDNLEVLKLLYKPYFGAVKMIYIDPPYNTGNDFVYPDNYADPLDTYLQISGQKDQEGNLLTSNPDTSGRYHSAWLSMMYPRLFLARQLLSDDGLIFISIDDNELADTVLMMNEIFGEENQIAIIAWEKRFTRSNNAKLFTSTKDSIIVYRKTDELVYLREGRTEKSDSIYSNPDNDPRGDWTSVSYVNPASKSARPNLVYKIINPINGESIEHPTNAWKFSYTQYQKHHNEGRLYWGKEGNNKFPRLKKFLTEVSDGMVPVDIWSHESSGTTDEGTKEVEALIGKDVFNNPKPIRLIQRMLQIATDKESEDIVLDFFAGSGSTAHAVMQQNSIDGGHRKFILVQLPEPIQKPPYSAISDITIDRVKKAIVQYNSNSQTDFTTGELDLGFKAFTLTQSNFKQWRGADTNDPAGYADTMGLHSETLFDTFEPENVIYEVAIKEGFSLNCTIEKVEGLQKVTVYNVTDPDKGQSFYITLDEEFSLASLAPLNLTRETLFICRDSALTDETAANLALQCRLKTL